MNFAWCRICGGDFEQEGEKAVCTTCDYEALPADSSIEIRPEEAAELAGKGEAVLLDVRDARERALARIDGSLFIPIRQLRESLHSLDKSRPIIAYCHHGSRSLHAAAFLRSRGFNARSMKGGIEAWAEKIDARVGKY